MHRLVHRRPPVARRVATVGGAGHRRGARRRRRELRGRLDRARFVLSQDLAPSGAVQHGRTGGRRRVLVAHSTTRRAHLLLGSGRHPPSRHHARPRRGLPSSGLLPVHGGALGHRDRGAVPGGRHGHQAPCSRGGADVLHHARLHRLRRTRRRARRVPTTCSCAAHRRTGPCCGCSDRGRGTSPVRRGWPWYSSLPSTPRSGGAE